MDRAGGGGHAEQEGKNYSHADSHNFEGLDFFITEIPEEVFTYSEEEPMHFAEARQTIYPYLLVNIGSGVSMIKVSGPQQFERIGGSSVSFLPRNAAALVLTWR